MKPAESFSVLSSQACFFILLRVQLSQPYVATGHTSALISHIFVEIDMLWLFHIFFSDGLWLLKAKNTKTNSRGRKVARSWPDRQLRPCYMPLSSSLSLCLYGCGACCIDYFICSIIISGGALPACDQRSGALYMLVVSSGALNSTPTVTYASCQLPFSRWTKSCRFSLLGFLPRRDAMHPRY